MPDTSRTCGECARWALFVHELKAGCMVDWNGAVLGCCARQIAAGTVESDKPGYVFPRTFPACADFRPRPTDSISRGIPR
jgi:hypothetical protein